MQHPFDDDQIPLLDDLIVPGNAATNDGNHAEQIQTKESSENLPAHAVKQKPPAGYAAKTAFEAAIEATVTEVLNRHLETARKEITRAVLTEVRARLTGGSKLKQPEEPTKK